MRRVTCYAYRIGVTRLHPKYFEWKTGGWHQRYSPRQRSSSENSIFGKSSGGQSDREAGSMKRVDERGLRTIFRNRRRPGKRAGKWPEGGIPSVLWSKFLGMQGEGTACVAAAQEVASNLLSWIRLWILHRSVWAIVSSTTLPGLGHLRVAPSSSSTL